MLFALPALLVGLVHRPSAYSRRAVLAASTSVIVTFVADAPSAADAAGFEDFVAAQQQQSRASDRSRFVDELPPLSLEERRKAQQEAAARIWQDSTARPAPLVSPKAAAPMPGAVTLDDEFTVEFDVGRPLGLKLKDLRVGFEYGTKTGTSRVVVSDITSQGQAALAGRVAIDDLVVAVDGANVETESAKDVQARLARAKTEGGPLRVTFKDARAFNEALSAGASQAQISTKIAPASATQEEQVLSIRRLELPERCTRNAQSGDLVEIRYTGRLADGSVFDGMELADRLGDDSIQFVLGRQPAGQFPPSWDVGLVGMCVGERRLLDVPPVLGFGPKGLPKRNVPPNARLMYDVELLAINALAIP